MVYLDHILLSYLLSHCSSDSGGDISYLELWLASCPAKQNCLGNFGKGHFKEHFCEIILNLDLALTICES